MTEPIEGALIEALQPIRQFVVATAIHHLFESGLYEHLWDAAPQTSQALAERFSFAPERLDVLLHFLTNENLLEHAEHGFVLSEKGRTLRRFRGWYTMLIGGYGQTFLSLGNSLAAGTTPAARRADLVGIGSCAISHYDAIPLTRSLMARIPGGVRRLLDLGCGNALYLVEFCKQVPALKAFGAEPDAAGYAAACTLVREEKLEARIQLWNVGAQGFLKEAIPETPDLTVLGFVLHEILGQDGEKGVVTFLQQLTQRFPELHLIVIEVDNQMRNPAVMRHGLSLAYYNAYYLLHPFTRQRLETPQFWEQLFERAGLEILAQERVNPQVDSTGLEVGYLLRRSDRKR